VGDVGDVDADLMRAVPERTPRQRVVVVASILGVDREDEPVAEIDPIADLGRGRWGEG
jgi:hypothetical protein